MEQVEQTEQAGVEAGGRRTAGPTRSDSLWLLTGTSASLVDAPEVEAGEYRFLALVYGGLPTGAELSDLARTPDAARLVSDLRRVSGLRWTELARVFNVDRRALHYWATGQQPSEENLRRLRRVLQFVNRHDRGNPRATRRHLIEPDDGGNSLLNQLIKQEAAAGASAGGSEKATHPSPARRRPPKLSREERAERSVFRPEDLLASGPSDEHSPERRILPPDGSGDG